MDESENKRIANELYAEAIALRKIADLLVEKSEILSKGGYDPIDSGVNRITDIDRELATLWANRRLAKLAGE